MKNKGFLQISFGWLFAIIVGAFILFLAIYFSVKLIGTEQEVQDAKTGKEIGILLNPLETGFETVRATSLGFPVDTRIHNRCNNNGNFGKQLIKISQKSFGKWTDTNIDVGFSNKYIFSEPIVESKETAIFSKPFEFPFKVADLIYMVSSNEKYCFIDAPQDIQDEISNINRENILAENCSESEDFVKVCFEGSGCDIEVSVNGKYIEKGEGKVYFEGDALMYAGIFADKEIYECQLKRLMQRIVHLAGLYRDKATLISQIGCHSNLGPDLLLLINVANGFSGSSQLSSMNSLVEQIKEDNDYNSLCRLW